MPELNLLDAADDRTEIDEPFLEAVALTNGAAPSAALRWKDKQRQTILKLLFESLPELQGLMDEEEEDDQNEKDDYGEAA